MNPYDHARSSARLHGGCWEDYHPLHSWFDASKATRCHFTHRALRHHLEGVADAEAVFGSYILRADGHTVLTETLALQHIREDCSIMPRAADWLMGFGRPDWLPDAWPSATDLAETSARRFGGTPESYVALHRWFLDTANWVEGAGHLLFRHHAFGIFEAEHRFGAAIDHGQGAVPTRVVGEFHVRSVVGRIPSASDYLRHIKGARWMLQATSPERLGLDRPRADRGHLEPIST
jgi:hypothetical protein